MNQEIWKPVVGFEGLYQVSSLGRVKSCERSIRTKGNGFKTLPEKILKPFRNNNGYLLVELWNNGVHNKFLVHRLVAEAFIPSEDLFTTTVNHKNEVKADNRVENLGWMSGADNTRYSSREGGTRYYRGSRNPRARLVRCIETGQTFECARDASRWLGLGKQVVAVSIRKGCRAGGYHWELI